MSSELVCMTLHNFGIGGCELQLLSLYRALNERNIDVIILHSRVEDTSACPLDKTLKCFYIPPFFYKFRLIPLYLAYLFRWKIKRLPTVFHCHTICYFTEQILRFAQKRKIRTLLKITGENMILPLKDKADNRLHFCRAIQFFLRKNSWFEKRSVLENLLFGKNRLQLYSKIDKYISINPNIKNELECFFVEKEKIFSISNGVDSHRFISVSDEEKKNLKKKFRLPENLHYITTISRFVEGKRIQDLIEAWAKIAKHFPNHRLLLIGDGPKKKAYEQQIALLEIRDRVVFTGFHLQPEKFLQLSDLFAFCSETEGCPNVLLEAMSSQLPIVASAIVGVEQLLSPPIPKKQPPIRNRGLFLQMEIMGCRQCSKADS